MPALGAHVHSDAICNALCGAEETRTPDFLLAKEALYQLSYGPEAAPSVALREPSSPCRGGRFWTRTRDLCLIRAVL